MGYPFGSEDHRRVQMIALAIVLIRRLTRTKKNDPLNRERCEAVICADLNARMLFFESIILSMETYVHPTNLNRKTHGIRDTNTRTRLSTLMKPERA
ncbi:hypothetical protein T10_1730 [Trichinella papuae]|uniref:Uncharacterized protein n=1 Tax=Trichinella papuae TaxID=268474 RepID=A0A0V1MX01_9BILA|nr:hypothetical protein T10_1730 [Trichinella papuae]